MSNEENAASSSVQEAAKNTDEQRINTEIESLYNDLTSNKKVDRVVILECVYLSFKLLKKYTKKTKEEKIEMSKLVVNKIIDKSDLSESEKSLLKEIVDILVEPTYNVVYRSKPWFKKIYKPWFKKIYNKIFKK